MGANSKGQRYNLQITGQVKNDNTKVNKKFLKSIKIPTGGDYFCVCSTWVPNTPGYSKAPKVVLTLNNHRDKIQLIFPSALDLAEFADTLNQFVKAELKEVNAAQIESLKDYQLFNELLAFQASERAKQKAEEEYYKKHNEANEGDHEVY